VVCHMPWSLAIFGPVARRAGVPLIFWMHDAAQGRHWIERWAGRTKPDLVLCNSRFTAGTLPRLFPRGLPRHEVIYYPVSNLAVTLSAQERAGLRGELDTPSDACVILQVGRMEPYKGHTLHLDALARLAALPGWVCWIVGGAQRPHEAAYLAELKARGADSGIADRIRFLGERRDVPRLLACADIFCQPNLRGEPFGIVFIEALQAGLPVVTTALGGALEIVDEDCGRRVAPNDPAALADALHELIASPGLRAQLGGRGPARAELLSHPAAALAKMEMLIGGAVS
jgi:glycosyltransferase involved in cell wall biosynthesis